VTVVLNSPLALPRATTHAPHLHPDAPCLRAILRRVGSNLLVACAIPAVIFTSLMFAFGITAALLGTLTWSYGALGWQVVSGRRKSGLLLITSTVLTVRTVIALASGNTFLYFLQPVATDACVATAFFVSLMTARPAIARLAADFYPMTDEVAQRPRIQQLFRQLTLLWACTCAVKAGVTFWLLNTMSVEAFVVLKSGFVLSMNGLTIATTIMAALVVAKAEGLVGHAVTPTATATA
jgi:hypothetical protein